MGIAVTLHDVGLCCRDLGQYDNALIYLNQALKIINSSHEGGLYKDRIWASIQQNVGKCLIGMQQYNRSWDCLQQSLNIFEKLSLEKENDLRIINTFKYMGECLIGKEQYAEALAYLQKALKFYQTETPNAGKDARLAETLYQTGVCLIQLQEHADALNCLKQSLNIYENFVLNDYVSTKMEAIRSKIDECSDGSNREQPLCVSPQKCRKKAP